MFYRMKFDGWIGGMLRASQVFSSDAESIEWWPAGATRYWVRWGKEAGVSPADAACMALARTVLSKVQKQELKPLDAYPIVQAAVNLATHHGSAETLQVLRLLQSDIEAYEESASVSDSIDHQVSADSKDGSQVVANASKLVEMARFFSAAIEPSFRTTYPALFAFPKAHEWPFFVTVASVWRACVGLHQGAPSHQRTATELAVRRDLETWRASGEKAFEHLHNFAMEAIAGENNPRIKAERLIAASALWVVWNLTDNQRFRGEEQAVTQLRDIIDAEFGAYWTLEL